MEMNMPKVAACSVESCAYNTKKSCHALAITVGEPGGDPACDTFFEADQHGGAMDMTAGVGACKLGDCKFNKNYECVASSITVEMQIGQPNCMTYQAS
jgi:hypothetical protein